MTSRGIYPRDSSCVKSKHIYFFNASTWRLITETHPRPEGLQKQPGGRTSMHRRLMRQPEKSICYIWFERNRSGIAAESTEYSSISERTKKEVSANWNVGLKGESGTRRQTGKANGNEKDEGFAFGVRSEPCCIIWKSSLAKVNYELILSALKENG